MKETLEICKDEKDFPTVHKAIQEEIENIKNEQKQYEIEFDKKIEAANKAGDKKAANQAKRDKKIALQDLEETISMVDVLTINDEEAFQLSGEFVLLKAAKKNPRQRS
jgi:hypothetical protein